MLCNKRVYETNDSDSLKTKKKNCCLPPARKGLRKRDVVNVSYEFSLNVSVVNENFVVYKIT